MEYRFQYLRDEKGQPVGCLAIKLVETSKTDEGTIIQFQLSVLNPADRFNRDLARNIALGRLKTSAHTAMMIGEVSKNRITRTVMYAVSVDKSLPARAVKAAKLWLENLDRTAHLEHGVYS